MLMKWPLVLISTLVSCLALAQVSPGGGSGSGTAGMDGNPQNPANWETLPSVVQGNDTADRTEINQYNVPESAHYTRDWTTMIWYRNGVSLGTVEFAIPFSAGKADTGVDMTSQGSITCKLHWKSPAPAPTSVRVRVQATSIAMSQLRGTWDVDNGLGTPIEESYDTIIPSRTQSGGVIRTVSVDASGIAQYKVTKSAHGSGVPSGIVHYPGCWANAYGASMAVDIRNVLINMVGASTHFEKQAGPDQPMSFGYDEPIGAWSQGLQLIDASGHYRTDIYQHKTQSYNFPSTSVVVSALSYGTGASNSATWHFGFPLPTQKWVENRFQTYFDPMTIDPFKIAMSGAAVTESKPTESYVWGGFDTSSSGNLPDGDGTYLIPNYLSQDFRPDLHLIHEKYFDPYDTAKLSSAETTDYVSPNATGSSTVTLKYTWSDGISATSQRTLVYHPHLEVTLQSGYAQVDWQVANGFIPLSFDDDSSFKRAPCSGAAKVTDAGDYDVILGIKHALGTVSTVIGLAGTFVDVPAGIEMAATAHDVFDKIFELIGEPKNTTRTVSSSDGCPAVYYYDGALHNTMKSASAESDYEFQAMVRPRVKLTPMYTDSWNTYGYGGRSGLIKKGMERQTSAPEVRYFRWVGGDFGGGGGGTGGTGTGGTGTGSTGSGGASSGGGASAGV